MNLCPDLWQAQAGFVWGTYSAVAAGVLTFVVLLWLRQKFGKKQTLPPGPRGLPLLGYLPFLEKNLHVKLRDLSREYGPVFGLKVGAANIVVLNDFESIKEGLCKKELLSRLQNVARHAGVDGMTTLNGKRWSDNRKFALHMLRDAGLGKKAAEEHVMEESRQLLERISDTGGAALNVQEYVLPSMSNNVAALVFGSGLPYDDPRRKRLDYVLSEAVAALAAGSFVTVLPALLDRMAGRLPFTRLGTIRRTLRQLLDFISTQVEEHLASGDEQKDRDFINGYLEKIKEHQDEPNSSFNMEHLIGTVLNFFGAGSNTVALSVHWHMLNCAMNADTVQSRIQKEIDDVVGSERRPSWADRTRMPFTMATIWEMYRWRTISPLGIPRGATEDTHIRGFSVPKGTVVIANLWAVHMDPKLWTKPDEFDPTRFMDEEGWGILAKPEYLIPFSIGKRMCPGETLATVEIFVYLTSLLQKFRVLPEEGHNVCLDTETTSFNIPRPQKLRFLTRH
ncbi:cytochrome P450 2F3 [Ixodes scapularis]|uniref:cytochrome P450 2F3 n=1 Tax=Ixodes scapularis TaxID=6945 RepID=UPI001A9EF72A|nr:cytochrome P450 2F3 [Ixodes scapularis]